MLTHQAKGLGTRIHCVFIFVFCALISSKIFCTRSYQIRIIVKQIYLTLRWHPKDTTTPGQSRPGSNSNERVLQTIKTKNLTIRFSLVPYLRHPFLGVILPFCQGYSRHTQSHADRAGLLRRVTTQGQVVVSVICGRCARKNKD